MNLIEQRRDRLAGTLMGTAIGDALGLYVEGLSGKKIQRKFGTVDRYLMPFGVGLLSDDTEQTAIIAEALALYPGDALAFERHLRWKLVAWFWTLPPGVGKATAQACLLMTCGIRNSGIRSAGNGAAMRSAIIGTFFCEDAAARAEFGKRAAMTTHTDERAVEGALFVAELAAACSRSSALQRDEAFGTALSTVSLPALQAVLSKAQMVAASSATIAEAAQELGTSGFIMQTLPFAAFCFLRFGDNPRVALVEAVSAGGDTDSIGAILGAWLGALHGRNALPEEFILSLHQGPIDLNGLSLALSDGTRHFVPFNYIWGLVRNLLLLPIVLFLAIWRFSY